MSNDDFMLQMPDFEIPPNSEDGIGEHRQSTERFPSSPPPIPKGLWREYHPLLREAEDANSPWDPYTSRLQFEVADFLFRKNQMSGGDIDHLFSLWSASLAYHHGEPPFANHREMYDTIDATTDGGVPWESFISSNDSSRPSWMNADYEVWFRNPKQLVETLISNPDFADEFDYAPYHEYHGNSHRFCDLMSGDWAWKQADLIAQDPSTHGSMFVPIILGSDKTTVSVATGDNEYWPIYLSIGNIHNNVRRAHRNGVIVLGFLAIAKTERQYAKDVAFRKFRRQLFHTSLAQILQPLRPAMTVPVVVQCGDGQFRRAVYGLGPYIADYPEQCLLACVVQGWCAKCLAPSNDLDTLPIIPRSKSHTAVLVEVFELGVVWDQYGLIGDIVPFTEDFPRADIHELLSPDLLHQVIKGAFKDHLVTWIEEYLEQRYGNQRTYEIISKIDRRIAVVPLFAGIRQFPQGRGFKQWTGADSTALMKVYLAAVEGLIPKDMVKALHAFLEFCYTARRDILDTQSLQSLRHSLTEISANLTPPRQHALVHYPKLIREFGAPNGLCSSITESKHIKAIKKPWRRSNRYNALGQMLVTNQRLDQLAASRVKFKDHGLLEGSLADEPGRVDTAESKNHDGDDDDSGDEGPVSGERTEPSITMAKRATRRKINASEVGEILGIADLVHLIQGFLQEQQTASWPSSAPMPDDFSISMYPSAKATFYAPSDISGIGGMRKERIRAVQKWRKGPARYDTVFIKLNNGEPGIRSFSIARVRLFLTIKHYDQCYECALVHDYVLLGNAPSEVTGMWKVKPAKPNPRNNHSVLRIIPLNMILRAAQLIPVYHGAREVPQDLKPSQTLDTYHLFYVNKFIDHHTFEIAF
ncbi:hypothetical protein JOM56_013756 [Amanita muscaria]